MHFITPLSVSLLALPLSSLAAPATQNSPGLAPNARRATVDSCAKLTSAYSGVSQLMVLIPNSNEGLASTAAAEAALGVLEEAAGKAGCEIAAQRKRDVDAKTGAKTKRQISDSEILNFALNLEYLEASFYVDAATSDKTKRQDLSLENTLENLGETLDGATGPLLAALGLKTKRQDLLLEDTLKIDGLLDIGIETMPEADLGAKSKRQDSDTNFLLGAYIFEDVGVTADVEAGPLVKTKRQDPNSVLD